MIGKILMTTVGAALLVTGCATDHEHHHRDHAYRYDDGDRTRVREYDRTYDDRYDSRYGNWDNPNYRYRGKHPDAMGWNDPYWYGR